MSAFNEGFDAGEMGPIVIELCKILETAHCPWYQTGMVEGRLPNFFVIGSQKSGTSSLFQVLRRHPEIFVPPIKEVNFFFDDATHRLGLGWYQRQFSMAADRALCGDISPGYLCNPRTPERIYRLRPNAKLIVILRDPIQRAYSQYWDNRRRLREPRTFDELASEPLHHVFVKHRQNYFSRGVYHIYLKRYYELFSRAQILPLWFSDLRRSPDDVFRKVFQFLGVDEHFEDEWMTKKANRRTIFDNPLFTFFFHRPRLAASLPSGTRWALRWGTEVDYRPAPISAHIVERLHGFYRPHDESLASLLNTPVPWLDCD
ncbi:MAG: sulfotransferase [Myxococcota bacterium]|nr:sulfotransferase [Myxococcota bacterium]